MSKLKEDNREQSFLRDETKYFVESALTYIIEILMGKNTEEFNDEDIATLDAHRDFQNTDLLSKPRKKDNKRIIEYTHAVKLLKDYFAASGYGQNYKNSIISANKDKLDFDERTFRKEYDAQCERERKILEMLGGTRNETRGHDIEQADMGEIYMWIRQLMEYIVCFREYRLEILAEYDNNLGLQEQYDKLDGFYVSATKLKENCFESSKEDYTVFLFGDNEYKISDKDREDFGLLVSNMAREWNNGIRHIRRASINDEFEVFLRAYFRNSNKLLDYEEAREKLLACPPGSTQESVEYMGILYMLYPSLSRLVWKGNTYSDSHFASVVLQIIIRHPAGKGYGIDNKKTMLFDRINGLDQWDDEKDNTKKGIGIDILEICKRNVISNYFNAHKKSEVDSKDGYTLDEINKACKFEDMICKGSSREFVDENYDEIIDSVLDLIAVMKGKVTYWCPVTAQIFKNTKEYRKFILSKIESESIEDIFEYVKQVRNDRNLIWWVQHPQFSD